MSQAFSRRRLLAGTIALSAATYSKSKVRAQTPQSAASAPQLVAAPAKFPADWPVWDASDADGLMAVLKSGHWGRLSGKRVADFEKRWAEAMQARFCIATSSGTTALLTALGALNIGPGDEVILPPYTFVASFNVITNSFALPVFVDSDIDSMQIDGTKIAEAVTTNTKLILPVHIGGTPANLDLVSMVAKEKGIPFIEDACQAPLAVWRGKPVGTHGLGGCLSFQATKNLTAGEGGAVLTNDEEFANKCYNFHTPGGGRPVESLGRGSNYRMTEFQGSLLVSQLARLESQAERRDENAKYLSELLAKIPGISPAKWDAGCDRSAWHLFMFRYDPSQFNGRPRETFLKELGQAGFKASGGYTPLNRTSHVMAIANNPHYIKIYGKEFMSAWADKNQCPVNDRLCTEAVWFTQPVLLGARSDMERIAAAIDGIRTA